MSRGARAARDLVPLLLLLLLCVLLVHGKSMSDLIRHDLDLPACDCVEHGLNSADEIAVPPAGPAVSEVWRIFARRNAAIRCAPYVPPPAASESLADLLRRMLDRDPATRITLEGIMVRARRCSTLGV